MKYKSYILSVLLLALILSAWTFLVKFYSIPAYILPTPQEIFQEFIVSRGILFAEAQVTFTELILGFITGITFGFLVALIIAFSPTLRRAIFPFLLAQQTIPIVILAPLFIIWFGFGILPQIVIVMLVCFFPVAINTSKGLLQVDQTMVDLMHSYGASERQIFTKIRLPSSMPYFFTSLRLAATLSVVGAVIGEWSGSEKGLGRMMLLASSQLETSLVFAIIFVLMLMGLLLFSLTALTERLVAPWSRNPER